MHFLPSHWHLAAAFVCRAGEILRSFDAVVSNSDVLWRFWIINVVNIFGPLFFCLDSFGYDKLLRYTFHGHIFYQNVGSKFRLSQVKMRREL